MSELENEEDERMNGEKERQFQIIKNIAELGGRIDKLLKTIEIRESMRVIARGKVWSTRTGYIMVGKKNEKKIMEQLERICRNKKIELIAREE